MAYRGLVGICMALGVAASCTGDPAKRAVMAEAGAGGEAAGGSNGSGGSSLQPQAGMPTVEAGAGGEAPLPGTSGAPGGTGSGGEPATNVGGAGADQGGAPQGGAAQGGAPSAGAGGMSSEPNVSQCGEGLYDDVEFGCVVCPTLPEIYYPTALGCGNYTGASFDYYTHTLELRFSEYIREGFSGTVAVTWVDEDASTGGGEYEWYFDNETQAIRVLVLDAPETAQSFGITYLAIQDACGFSYYSSAISVYFDEVWSCATPPESACGVGMYESGVDGCFSCPAPPEPNVPTSLGCGNFVSGNFNSYDNWLDLTFDAGIHEALGGKAVLGWRDDQQISQSANFDWSYDPSSSTLRFYVPEIPDDTTEIFIPSLAFTDACDFEFAIGYAVKVNDDGEGGLTMDCGG